MLHAGESRCILDIPRWDVDWQLFYRFTEPVAFEDGDALRISCAYSTETEDAPVAWGIGASDEMCLAYTFVTDR